MVTQIMRKKATIIGINRTQDEVSTNLKISEILLDGATTNVTTLIMQIKGPNSRLN